MTSLASMRHLWVLMGTVFIDMIGFLIVMPLLPFYGERYGASESTIGLLIAIFAFMQLTSAPLWGRLSDRLGRRPVILGSLVVSALAFLLFGLAESVFLLFLSRAVQGVGGGTTGVLQAYVSDSVPPEKRTQALGWVTAATSAGVMVGPLLGSAAFTLGEAAPGFLAAGLCVLNFLFAWLLLPESIGSEEGRDEAERAAAAAAEAAAKEAAKDEGSRPDTAPAVAPQRTPLRRSIAHVLAHPRDERSLLIWIYALGMMAFMAMNGVMVLYLERSFGVTEQTIGLFIAYIGGLSLLMRALLLGPINRRLGDVRTLRLGTLSLGLGLASIPLPRLLLPEQDVAALVGLAVVIALVPIGTALLFPATTSLVSRHSVRNETGQNLGVQQAFGGVARMTGPIWSTAVFQHIGISAPFWIAAALMGTVGLVALTVRRPGEAERQTDAGRGM